MKNHDLVSGYLMEALGIINRFSALNIAEATDLLYATYKNHGTIYTCGNGGSASTATHFACDLNKSTIVEGKKRVKAVCLNDNIPLMSAIINDDGWDNLFTEQLYNKVRDGDLLVALSVHGGTGRDKAELWSQNLVKAMQCVRE